MILLVRFWGLQTMLFCQMEEGRTMEALREGETLGLGRGSSFGFCCFGLVQTRFGRGRRRVLIRNMGLGQDQTPPVGNRGGWEEKKKGRRGVHSIPPDICAYILHIPHTT